MCNFEEYERELSARTLGDFKEPYVVELLRHYRGDWDAEPHIHKEFQRKGFGKYPYLLVMPAGDRSLQDILSKERLTALNKQEFCRQIAEGLKHMHDKNYIHGDIKPKNIMRINNQLTLIDLDASSRVGEMNYFAKLRLAISSRLFKNNFMTLFTLS
jgi:serine/threonine protein kinase